MARALSIGSRTWVPFVAAGAVVIVAGGLVSAAGGEAPSKHLSWASSYLVLVWGAAQVFLGGCQAMLSSRVLGRGILVGELVAFNAGNAAVLAGTLSGLYGVLYAGCTVLVVALLLFGWVTWGQRAERHVLGVVYRVVLVVLAVSVPIGAVLAR